MIQTRKIECDIYDFEVILCWNCTNKQRRKKLIADGLKPKLVDRLSKLRASSASVLFPTYKTPARYYMFLGRKQNSKFRTCVHESFHIINHALSSRHINCADNDGDEAWAYALEWLTQEICKTVNAKP